MAQIPNTQKKLREARFFLSNMGVAANSTHLDREDFDFYLSAFLSAGRSTTLFLQKEQKTSYDAWFPNWLNALREDEKKLLSFMNEQRVAEVHVQGAETQRDIETVPLTHLELPYRHPAYYGFIFEAAPGTPAPEIGLNVHYFSFDGQREKALDLCRRYLDLLERLVRDFHIAFPI